MTRIWVLGAPDPEMALIERLLARAGERSVCATDADGRRVTPATAYAAALPQAADGVLRHGGEVCLVECVGEAPEAPGVVRIDHHRPGDPGYGRPPAEYWSASSVGQAIAYLAAREPAALVRAGVTAATPEDVGPAQDLAREIRLTAAADHCLAAAYRGLCPGVDPEELMAWRAETRATHQRRPAADVLADVEAARAALAAAPRIMIAGVPVADVGDRPIPELPEAAARDGTPFVARLLERGRRKTVLQAAPAEVVSAWMAEQRAAGRAPYGDPARGFAGVYEEG